jgi:hypothetical protein
MARSTIFRIVVLKSLVASWRLQLRTRSDYGVRLSAFRHCQACDRLSRLPPWLAAGLLPDGMVLLGDQPGANA